MKVSKPLFEFLSQDLQVERKFNPKPKPISPITRFISFRLFEELDLVL